MSSIVLSFGAIDALIPLLVILVLIAAAGGLTRGFDIMKLFGIEVMTGIGAGAAAKGSLLRKSAFSKKAGQTFGGKPTEKIFSTKEGSEVGKGPYKQDQLMQQGRQAAKEDLAQLTNAMPAPPPGIRQQISNSAPASQLRGAGSKIQNAVINAGVKVHYSANRQSKARGVIKQGGGMVWKGVKMATPAIPGYKGYVAGKGLYNYAKAHGSAVKPGMTANTNVNLNNLKNADGTPYKTKMEIELKNLENEQKLKISDLKKELKDQTNDALSKYKNLDKKQQKALGKELERMQDRTGRRAIVDARQGLLKNNVARIQELRKQFVSGSIDAKQFENGFMKIWKDSYSPGPNRAVLAGALVAGTVSALRNRNSGGGFRQNLEKNLAEHYKKVEITDFRKSPEEKNGGLPTPNLIGTKYSGMPQPNMVAKGTPNPNVIQKAQTSPNLTSTKAQVPPPTLPPAHKGKAKKVLGGAKAVTKEATGFVLTGGLSVPSRIAGKINGKYDVRNRLRDTASDKAASAMAYVPKKVDEKYEVADKIRKAMKKRKTNSEDTDAKE